MVPIRTVAKVVVVNDSQEVLLLRRSKTAPRRALQWDFPGGLVDEGEEVAHAAARELTEEADLAVSTEDLKLVWSHTAIKDELSVTWLIYIAKAPSTTVTLSYEHDKYCWLPLQEAIDAIEYPLQKSVLEYIAQNQLIKHVC
jgi:8-oxo-dGTP pyrophosphatase MutT (NUDIX family)